MVREKALSKQCTVTTMFELKLSKPYDDSITHTDQDNSDLSGTYNMQPSHSRT